MGALHVSAAVVTLLVMVQMWTAASATLQDNYVSTGQEIQEQEGTPRDVQLLKRSLRDALEQHFQLLQEAEQDIVTRIEALKAKRQAISERKRSHYMCLVNLIACYRK